MKTIEHWNGAHWIGGAGVSGVSARTADVYNPATGQVQAAHVEIITKFPSRIGYVHIKQMDPAIVARADREGLAFGQAVAMGASCEPPRGEPVVEDVAKALRALDRDLFVVVEQDMYPCDFGQPKPIAQRTYTYLRSLGIGEE